MALRDVLLHMVNSFSESQLSELYEHARRIQGFPRFSGLPNELQFNVMDRLTLHDYESMAETASRFKDELDRVPIGDYHVTRSEFGMLFPFDITRYLPHAEYDITVHAAKRHGKFIGVGYVDGTISEHLGEVNTVFDVTGDGYFKNGRVEPAFELKITLREYPNPHVLSRGRRYETQDFTIGDTISIMRLSDPDGPFRAEHIRHTR